MSTKLAKVVADFQTSLATAIAVGATSFSIQSATDDDGVSLASGRYLLTVDTENSSKEHYSCDLSGTAITNVKSISRQGSETSGSVRAHRVGASVVMTDFAHMLYIVNLLSGTTDLDSSTPLKYDGTASISNANHLATKAYVDGVAVSGAPDASDSTKGLVEQATQAEVDAGSTSGGTSAPLFVTPSRVRAKKYNDPLASTGSSNAYVLTVAPAITAYAAGQVFAFIANFANTGAATLNVSGLGAKTIKKDGGTSDLVANDIKNGQAVVCIYDGTNMGMVSIVGQSFPVVDIQTFTSSGTWTKPTNAKTVDVILFGAGGGGSGGSTSTGAQPSPAGNGGGGGALSKKSFAASYLSSTETVTIGTGGAGSTQTAANTFPVPTAGTGGNTTFGSKLIANGGTGATGPIDAVIKGTSAGAGGAASNADVSQAGGDGALATSINNTGGSAASTSVLCSPRGGGSGAWFNGSGSVAAGSGGSITGTPSVSGGSGGTGNGAAGTAPGNDSFLGGTGGAGGGQSGTSGGTGGAGGYPGGGGGGGGGNYNGGGTPSTFKGGNGADGLAVVITYF